MLALALTLLLVTPSDTESVFVNAPVVGEDREALEAAPLLSRRIATRVTERSGLPASTSSESS